ncbi:alpha/beta-hydrolase [Hymenopellis radicata]|nr:alpha/beta-hydrolase [Hymenopellis radicata]
MLPIGDEQKAMSTGKYPKCPESSSRRWSSYLRPQSAQPASKTPAGRLREAIGGDRQQKLLSEIYGRADDQITHSTGEKTNPVPIEIILRGDKHLANAIMFGGPSFNLACLFSHDLNTLFDPTDSEKLADFATRSGRIKDTVTIAHEQAPQHSRIYKEMILVASPSKPFEYTSKGSLRRGAIIELYHDEIEGIYNAATNIVHDVLSPSITGDMNIFDVGGDSLTATSIRNSLLRAIHQSKAVPLSAIRLLPQNFVFEFPTIVSLSAFIRGFVIGSFRVPSAQELEEEKDGYYPADPPLPMSGQSVVKLLEGKGEPPLIMIHGAGGFFFEYAAYTEKFRTAVWTLQVTPDTPLTTLDEMAAFYFAKIKEQQPTGPYRLAAYSSTSILGFALAKLFEDNGDDVVQLAMLDHFPPLFVYAANRFVALSRDTISGLMRRDANWPIMEKQFQAFLNASKGLPAPALMKTAANTVKKYITLVADYVYDLTTDSTGASSLELMVKWMASVKAPVCVYAAKTGAVGAVADEDKEDWADLGAKYLPGTRVVLLEGGHYEFLMNEKVIRSLQEGF